MIDAYVINLEKDIQRKEALIKNIKEHNVNSRINFNFIKAIEEKTFNEYNFKICNTWFDTLLRTGITVGEIGCALSHYKCWNDFYNSKKEYAIIFEDDIQFTYDFNAKLTILINYPKNADIVYIHRKPLNQHGETKYDANFTNIKASYWACGYLLTRSGVEKLLKTNFLDNLIVVDEFIPLLYDSEYLTNYKLYYNNINLVGYSINNSFIKLVSDNFLESNTFHSNYYKYDNNFIVITSDLNCSLSSKKRFIYSCEKYSLNYLIINEVDSIFQYLHAVDDDKIIIICDCNFSFFINNPLSLFLKNVDSVYANFNDTNQFTSSYISNSAYFYGKKSILKRILNENHENHENHEKNINNLQINGCIKILSSEDTNISISNDDYIIVNGKSNVLLLNKYENYILRKLINSYGFKLSNKINNFTFRIRVNVLVYNLNYKMCLKHLKNIDYPSELLDIHIYTNQKLNIKDNIPIHELSVFDAYKDMYNYFTEYDYIWLINTDYIITEYSLLKKCISSNKNISSGLQKSRTSVFANFWGDLSKNGWYKRSDDYFDILNLNKCNIWNLPYVNGNILIKSELLNTMNFLNIINYNINTDVDMIFCENARLNNEGMYLLNDKIYGYICEKLPYLPDWSEETILHEDFYDFLYNDKNNIFNEIGQDIWSIPFFSTDFCNYLINIAEKNGNWSDGIYSDSKQIDKRLGAIENIPTQDIHLKDLNLHDFWQHVVSNYFKKILQHLYVYTVKDYNIAFIVKYDYENGQKSLQPHHDSSVYTINIALNSSDEYTGGGVNFISKKCVFVNKNPGYLLLHPGRVTHRHEAIPINSGKRYVLVSFNN